ncbi:MAG: DUF2961 domain-containing protein [Lachnospiraceae bacterium]|nr:DUF2961 domain-containing protein [Lachnospiraceae bacterium]
MTDIFKSLYTSPIGENRSINYENKTGEKGKGGMEKSPLGVGRKGSPCIPVVKSGETVTLADICGSGVIEHIWVTVTDKVSEKNRYVLRDLVIRFYWDNADLPAIECPLGDFFCLGFGASYCVNSLPVSVNPTRGMNCYFSMPFKNRAVITLENQCDEDIHAFFYQVDYCLKPVDNDTLYFHAQWRRQKITQKGSDYAILDNIHGKGHYIGTFLGLATLERYWYGEGEVKIYIDGDKEFPTVCGTGTEDYFGGAWSFATQKDGKTIENNYCGPFLGYPYYSTEDTGIHNDYHTSDKVPERAFYRFHLTDPIRFYKDIRVTVQQIGVYYGGLFERQDDVCSTAYWYQDKAYNETSTLPSRYDRWPR